MSEGSGRERAERRDEGEREGGEGEREGNGHATLDVSVCCTTLDTLH